MKAGDKVWLACVHWGVDGLDETRTLVHEVNDNHVYSIDTNNLIPHTEALPAVARWLAAHPDAAEAMTSLVQLATDRVSVRWPDDADLHLDLAIGRALLAALTTEEPA